MESNRPARGLDEREPETAVAFAPIRLAPRDQGRTLTGARLEPRPFDSTLPVAGAGKTRAAAAVRIADERLSSPGVGVLVLLLYAAPLAALLYAARAQARWMEVYLQIRWVALGLPFFAIVWEGFRDSAWRGALCLIFPPYFIWHALTRVESYWRQTLVLGGLAVLAAEYLWFTEQSVMTNAGATITDGIDSVTRLIRRAGEAGDLK